MPLAGQNVSQKIRTFWGWKPSKIRTLNLIKVLPVLIKKCCPLCKCEINTEREENLSEKEWLVLLIIKLYIAGHNIYVENIFRHIDTFFKSSRPEVFLENGVLKICSKCTGKNPCRRFISIKLLCNFIEIAHWHGCFPVNLLHIFKTPFPRNTSGLLLLLLLWLLAWYLA